MGQRDSLAFVTLRSLLGAPLSLEPISSWCQHTDMPINWVSTTELHDPSRFLRAGDLVLTTGINNRTGEQQAAFVDSLLSVPVVALGYGVGLIDQHIPEHLVHLAERGGLALFEVPVTTPFTAVSHWVAEELYASRYAAVQRATEIQAELTRALLGEQGLEPILLRLSQLTGSECAVIDRRGDLLASEPASVEWEPLSDMRARAGVIGSEVTLTPIEIERVVVAYLALRHFAMPTPVAPFVAGLIGLELARRQAILTGRRELLGEVLDDAIHEVLAGPEIARKLQAHGVGLTSTYRVLVGTADAGPTQLRSIPWNLSDLFRDEGDRIHTALIGDMIIALIPATDDASTIAHKFHRQLSSVGRGASVGVGQPHSGTRAIRIGFHEAHDAMSRGAGIRIAEGLDVTSLLLNSVDTPVREVAQATLQPLLDYDKKHAGSLVVTLSTYLRSGCTPHVAATRLNVHRNGLQYRLRKIEALTRHDLTSFEDQVRFWLALTALGIT
ncbi:PucR family transcriptional regulator [Nocardioides terrisoli]|uniref:PucR family transcriptional regulator n=1 Tax=Nocardioides terrisoli TaxID=3388267 RepID=UPI00287B97BA|nr:PucR family transcriptional regulator ligand-binding domain-containing protein [Nocardioides marmorisolisilvae]